MQEIGSLSFENSQYYMNGVCVGELMCDGETPRNYLCEKLSDEDCGIIIPYEPFITTCENVTNQIVDLIEWIENGECYPNENEYDGEELDYNYALVLKRAIIVMEESMKRRMVKSAKF